jgi:hypothetical protein
MTDHCTMMSVIAHYRIVGVARIWQARLLRQRCFAIDHLASAMDCSVKALRWRKLP